MSLAAHVLVALLAGLGAALLPRIMDAAVEGRGILLGVDAIPVHES